MYTCISFINVKKKPVSEITWARILLWEPLLTCLFKLVTFRRNIRLWQQPSILFCCVLLFQLVPLVLKHSSASCSLVCPMDLVFFPFSFPLEGLSKDGRNVCFLKVRQIHRHMFWIPRPTGCWGVLYHKPSFWILTCYRMLKYAPNVCWWRLDFFLKSLVVL